MCIWNIMADVFDFDNHEITQLLYVNYPVKKFMDAKQSMGVAACKGMGKTFLLKAKRMHLNESAGNEGALLLPKNQLVDTPVSFVLNKTHIRFLSSYYNWVDLWIGCISIYLLSQKEIKAEFSETDFSDLNDTVQNLINIDNNGVFHVLNRIINKNSQRELRDVSQAAGLLFALLQRINRPVYLFVDKLEEPFNRIYYEIPGSSVAADGRYNSSIWAYSQLSFAEAVYRLYSGRHHIKIYYGIRQEVLYGCENITRESTKIIQQMVSKLEYNCDDLYKMFQIYVKREKPENLLIPSCIEEDPVKALCGVSTIKHRSNSVEQIWAYIFRHSLQRPRDIMAMAMTLYENIVRDSVSKDETSLVRTCRHWINEISTRECMDYLTCLEPLFSTEEKNTFLHDILGFLRLLPTNVFTIETIIEYCHKYNKCNDKIECSKCSNSHYFSMLYNIGLLGYIYESKSELGHKNSIKHIGNNIYSTSNHTLPNAELYYAHPGLGNIIMQERDKAQLKYIPSNFVINSSEIFANSPEVTMLQHFCKSILGNTKDNRVFLTSTERDLSDMRKRIKNYLESAGYVVLAYEFDDFPQMRPDGMPFAEHHVGETHDHCLDIMLTCKHVIYIFGGRFGGIYKGKNYQQYIDENNEIIKIQPSVSFTEYLVAKKFGKNTKVYVSEKVELARGEWLRNNSSESYTSNHVDNLKVFKQLGYFNSLGNATWYDKYQDAIMLENYISKHFPKLDG